MEVRMVNVLQVISAPAAGGAEIFVRDLAIALQTLGHEVHVGFISRAADLGRDGDFEQDFLNHLNDRGIKWTVFGHECRRFPWLGMVRMQRYCSQHHISVVHTHLVYGLVFGLKMQIPHFFTEHNSRVRGPVLLRRVLKRLVTEHIAISSHCASTLEAALGVKPRVIINGVDSSRFPLRRRERPSDRCEIISVGRISTQKNYALLLAAVARLPCDVRSRVRVRIVGDGDEGQINKLKSLIQAGNLTETVELLGARSDVSELMQSSDLLVMSSSWEGLPVTLIESTMSGLPFVATDVGGCRELAENTGGGIIVPAGDAAALSLAIARLVNDRAERSHLADAALSNRDLYSIEAAARSHEALYTGAESYP